LNNEQSHDVNVQNEKSNILQNEQLIEKILNENTDKIEEEEEDKIIDE
jgi:uncharacterized protein YaaW (UPF0174 family)